MIRALAICVAMALPAAAQDVRPADAPRLADLDAHFGLAVRAALAAGTRDDVLLLVDVMRGSPVRSDVDIDGDWACRTIKLGGLTALTVNADFRCRITAAGDELWRLEKTTGSQRTVGTLSRLGSFGSFVYLGTGHVGAKPATGYASLPPDDQTPVEPNQTHAQVGVLEVVGTNAARLLLPAPILESRFDILALTR